MGVNNFFHRFPLAHPFLTLPPSRSEFLQSLCIYSFSLALFLFYRYLPIYMRQQNRRDARTSRRARFARLAVYNRKGALPPGV